MKRIFFTVIILLLVLLAGCKENQPIVGGDRDSHGCIGSAGYSWCEAKQKCLRVWEEKCETNESAQIANPASTNCIKNGGTLEIVDEANGQIGICTLSDGTKCEEWAYFRGECNATVITATKCSEPRPEMCTMEYRGVCGFFDSSIKCIKYPCAATYATGCTACSDPKVAYWVDGECPK
jgi:putative hemolysin